MSDAFDEIVANIDLDEPSGDDRPLPEDPSRLAIALATATVTDDGEGFANIAFSGSWRANLLTATLHELAQMTRMTLEATSHPERGLLLATDQARTSWYPTACALVASLVTVVGAPHRETEAAALLTAAEQLSSVDELHAGWKELLQAACQTLHAALQLLAGERDTDPLTLVQQYATELFAEEGR